MLHAVKLVMNNNLDWPWPCQEISITLKVLAHPNPDELCVMNPQSVHPKLSPLPLGAKLQWMSTNLCGEPKTPLQELHGSVSNGRAAAKALFESPSRTNKAHVRRAANSQKRIRHELTNNALRMHCHNMCGSLNQTAPQHTLCKPEQWSNCTMCFNQLKSARFVSSPPGRGLDTHATWEALMAGCIPIVARSVLDPMFEQSPLPVWLIDDWAEVTDEAVLDKSKEFLANATLFDWEKTFADGWKREFQNFKDG